MKKTLFTLCLLFLSSALFAQLSKEYKEVLIDGKMVSKWVRKTNYEKIEFYTIEDFNLGYETCDLIKRDYPEVRFIEAHETPRTNFKPDYEIYANVFKCFDKSNNLVCIYNKYGYLLDEYKYDKNNNLIYSLQNRNETFYEYDSSNNIVYSKDSWGAEEWKEYNSKNQLVKVTNSYGGELIYEYDSKGRKIRVLDGGILSEEYRYDSKDNVIYSYSMTYGEYEYKYDAKGNLIYTKYKYSDREWTEEWYEYTAEGKSFHRKTSDGYESWTKWNAKGKIIWYKSGSDYEEWYEYSADGNFCHKKDKNGKHTWYEEIYDSQGRLIEYNVYEPI